MWVLLLKDQTSSIHVLDAVQIFDNTSIELMSNTYTYISYIFKYMTIFDVDGIYLQLVSVGVTFWRTTKEQ